MDAKAAGDEVAVGGWVSRGGQRCRDARWFAVRLNRQNAPWAFARGEPFRVIASLELLGVLVGLMVLTPEDEFVRGAQSTGLVTLSCLTDNQGNSYLLDKLMTTKYPLGVILIELAWQCARRRVALRAEWVPRLQNEEADALTNGVYDAFDESKRVDVNLDTLQFGVLRDLLATGESYFAALEEARDRAREARAAPAPSGRRGGGQARGKRTTLRERDPW